VIALTKHPLKLARDESNFGEDIGVKKKARIYQVASIMPFNMRHDSCYVLFGG
jgi:hypothetical protein